MYFGGGVCQRNDMSPLLPMEEGKVAIGRWALHGFVGRVRWHMWLQPVNLVKGTFNKFAFDNCFRIVEKSQFFLSPPRISLLPIVACGRRRLTSAAARRVQPTGGRVAAASRGGVACARDQEEREKHLSLLPIPAHRRRRWIAHAVQPLGFGGVTRARRSGGERDAGRGERG
ncbi:hypothetical protein AXF42_Ash020903 [Apostasia shenzhenica]|uniref:Uncharacterized protein n=1 Tax=Apostasia shenzhenica TaxID=1088818 RepID=A0A2I0AD59_9ASPA|nr:hypothetical protein AXF42_Ash020903 [Apostasia shenzhenica]